MIKKLLALFSVVLAAAMCTSCASIDALSEKVISDEKTEEFLNDSLDAVAYLFAYDPEYAEKTEIDSDMKVRIAASAIAARNDYFDGMGSTFLIPAEDMEAEVAELFTDDDISDFQGNKFVSKDDNGDYHLLNGDWGDAQPKFEITDIYYGLVGSEPPTITVRYGFEYYPEEDDENESYEYEAVYTYEADKDSIYSFKISDYTGKNLK